MEAFRRILTHTLVLVLLTAFMLPFQNCTRTKFEDNSRTPAPQKEGGGGIDGKPYNSYGLCGSKVGVEQAVLVAPDFSKAWTVRSACVDLKTPVPTDASRLKLAATDGSTFFLGGRVYTTVPFSDGTASAPATSIQHPNLLKTYATLPPWKVAGVDFAVGVPSVVVLQNPATINLPGVTVDPVNHAILVTASNVTLNGYDFSLNGGWTVQVKGAANARILNSYFVESASQTQPAIVADGLSSNLYIGYSVVDGGGAGASTSDGAMIQMNGAGFTTEFCWVKNAPANIFAFGDITTSAAGLVNIRYNLIEDSGRASGGGLYTNFVSGSFSNVQIVFNTAVQTPGGTPDNNWNVDHSIAVQTLEIGNNVMVASTPGAVGYWMSFGGNLGAAVVHDNYFDLSGALGFAYPGTGAYGSFLENFDMKTGAALSTSP